MVKEQAAPCYTNTLLTETKAAIRDLVKQSQMNTQLLQALTNMKDGGDEHFLVTDKILPTTEMQ